MKVNYKQMYTNLVAQRAVLKGEVPTELSTEIPKNFNQIGWDLTIEKVELLLFKMNALRDVKGKLLTPQWYRAIFNRAITGVNEIDAMLKSIEDKKQRHRNRLRKRMCRSHAGNRYADRRKCTSVTNHYNEKTQPHQRHRNMSLYIGGI